MRKLAHIPAPGYGMPYWSYPRYVTPGAAQTVSVFDQPEMHGGVNVTRFDPYTGKVSTNPPQSGPSMTRQPRIASFHASNPAIFQSYFRVRWEGLTGLSVNLESGARKLNTNPNPSIPGRKEGQAIMSYNPWPSSGEIYPKAL